MKAVLLIAIVLAAGCAPSRPYQTRDTTTTTAAPPSSAARDTSDCEREAALAGVGERAKAFENCMRARSRGSSR